MITSIYIYPWDLWDGGIEKTLDRVVSLGVGVISVAVAYHGGKFFLPHNKKRKVFYHPEGMVYFETDRNGYGPLKPRTGASFQEAAAHGTDLFEEIIRQASTRGLQVRAWVVGLHNSYLGRRAPHCCMVNAFAERYMHALCPANEQVRHYLQKLLADLAARYSLDGIELESFDFMGFLHGDEHEVNGLPHEEILDWLLALCFCDSCKARARAGGLDIERVSRMIRQGVDALCKGQVSQSLRVFENAEVACLLEMRRDWCAGLFAQVQTIVQSSRHPAPIYGVNWMHSGPEQASPALLGRLGRALNGWVVAYPPTQQQAARFYSEAKAAVPADKRLIVGIRLLPPQLTNKTQLRKYWECALAAQPYGINFYNYDMAPQPVLEELRYCLSGLK